MTEEQLITLLKEKLRIEIQNNPTYWTRREERELKVIVSLNNEVICSASCNIVEGGHESHGSY